MIASTRGSRRPVAVAAATLTLLLSACARSGVHPTSSPLRAAQPLPGCPQAHLTPPPPADALGGPAVDSLTGGAARSSFDLDGGALAIRPPDPGDRPAVSAATAACEALASDDSDASLLGDDATHGLAYGYARVTVRDGVLDRASVPAWVPPPRAYHSRLAWVVIVKHAPVPFCHPSKVRGATPDHGHTPPPLPDYHAYEVFLVDAQTGANPLAYTEGGYFACGEPAPVLPDASVPTDRVSLPWRLLSRADDHYTATITTRLLPCDDIESTVLPDPSTPDVVSVVVQRLIGPPCGKPTQRRLTVHAAAVTGDLPAVLRPGPTGLVMHTPPNTGPPPVDKPMVEIGLGDCGRNIEVTVGTVLELPLLVDALDYPVTSSAPKVLGLLGDGIGPGALVRAWRPGRADLTIAPMPPSVGDAVAGCAKPWVLHVTVH